VLLLTSAPSRVIRININFIYQNSSFCLSKSTICISLFLTDSLNARQLASRLRRRFCTSASILSIVQINLRRNLASWRRSGRERTLIGLGGEQQAQPSKNTILMQNQKFNLHFRTFASEVLRLLLLQQILFITDWISDRSFQMTHLYSEVTR
jgi:hypothetical protein